MTEYKNREAAMEAAEKMTDQLCCDYRIGTHCGDCFVAVYVREGDNGEGDNWLTRIAAKFHYPKPRPIPEKGSYVMGENGNVCFSLGNMTASGQQLRCSEYSSGDGDVFHLEKFEPVEIIRNGRHARAVELLEASMVGMHIEGRIKWNRVVKEFLADEPGKCEKR